MRRIYLDKCLFSYLKKDERFTPLKDFFLGHLKELLFTYSPAHMKDFSKHPNALKYQKEELDFMKQFCNEHLLVYNKENNRMDIFSCPPNRFILEENTLYQSNIKSLDLTNIFNSINVFFERLGLNLLDLQHILESISIPIKIKQNASNGIFEIINESSSLWNFYRLFPKLLQDILTSDLAYRSFRQESLPETWQIKDVSQQWKEEEVIDRINDKLKSKGIKKTFFELSKMILDSLFNQENKEYLFKALYVGLDLFRYKSDSHNLDSILRDAEHAFYAAHCDYFMSSDKKLIEKSKAIYSYFQIQTKIIYIEEKQPDLDTVITDINQSISKSKDFQYAVMPFINNNTQFNYNKKYALFDAQYKLDEPFLNFFNFIIYSYRTNEKDMVLLLKKTLPDASNFVFITELKNVLDDICEIFGGDKQLYKSFKERFMQPDITASITWKIPNSDFSVIVKVDTDAYVPIPEIVLFTKREANYK